MTNKFFSVPVVTVSSGDNTTTNEQSINLPSGGGVKITLNVPCCVDSVLIYRSNSSNSETLLEELVLEDNLKKQPKVSFPLTYIDSGILTPGLDTYPTLTTLSDPVREAIPDPEFTLTETTGSLPAGDYYYRVAFHVPNNTLAPVFTDKDVSVFTYRPELTSALCYTSEDMSLEAYYVEEPDPYTYIDPFYSDVIKVGAQVGTKLIQEQEIVAFGTVIKKSVIGPIPVDIQLSARTYVVNKPVTIALDPPNISLEVLENKLVGTPEYLQGTVIKRYSSPGSINFYLSTRARFLYSASTIFFKVVS